MSTKIGKEAAKALSNKYNYHKSNTTVYEDYSNNYVLELFNNIIAINGPYGIEFNFKGWVTQTTVDRIQAVTGLFFNRKKGKLYYQGIRIDDYTWYRLCDFNETIEKLRKEQQNASRNDSKNASVAS